MTVCRHFLAGHCRFGNNCRFEHVAPTDSSSGGFGNNRSVNQRNGAFGNNPNYNRNDAFRNNASSSSGNSGFNQRNVFQQQQTVNQSHGFRQNTGPRQGGNVFQQQQQQQSSAFRQSAFGGQQQSRSGFQQQQAPNRQSAFQQQPQRQSAFGQSAFGQSAFGQSAFAGQQSMRQSAFGQSNRPQSTFQQHRTSAFGSSSFASTPTSPFSPQSQSQTQPTQKLTMEQRMTALQDPQNIQRLMQENANEVLPWKLSAFGPEKLPSMILGGMSIEEARWLFYQCRQTGDEQRLHTEMNTTRQQLEYQRQRILSDPAGFARDYVSQVQNVGYYAPPPGAFQHQPLPPSSGPVPTQQQGFSFLSASQSQPQHQTNAFGTQQPPSQAQTTFPLQSGLNLVQPHPNESNISQEDMQAFLANEFVLGSIPDVEPPLSVR